MNHQLALVPPLPTPNIFFRQPLIPQLGSNPNFPLTSTSNPIEITQVIYVATTIALPIAGIILLLLLIYAGFLLMTSTNNPDQAEKARQIFSTSLVGFLLIFAAYWIAQILQIIFGIPIIGN